MAMKIKVVVYWVVMPCGDIVVYYFVGPCCFHLQGNVIMGLEVDVDIGQGV